MNCIHCHQPLRHIDYFGTGHLVLADWSGAYFCPQSPVTVHEEAS